MKIGRSGAQIRYEVLEELLALENGNISEDYQEAEALVLGEATEEERVAYNMYMARVTGFVGLYKGR